jgi:lipopolysaccharide export system permease protein
MLNVHFFPSKRIAFYMARIFVVRTLAVLAALVIVLQTLDLLGESGKILAHPGNGDPQLWYYVSLRIPQLIARFLPFSVLLGTLITLATLNQHSEVIAMKAAGISAHQIIAPLVVASFAVAATSFFFNERIVTRANSALSQWQAVDYGAVPSQRGGSTNVWVRYGDDLIHARQVFGNGAGTRLYGITLYDRTGGILARTIQADSAEPSGNGWLLRNVTLFDIEANKLTRLPTMAAAEGADPRQFTLAKVEADKQDFGSLRTSLDQLRIAGRPTGPIEAGWWHKVSGPLSAILMPLLAAVAAFGLARSGQLFVRAVLGMALGFLYFVADNFALAMGNFGAYPPLLAAWGPFVLFLLIGETVLIRTEE